MVSGNVTIREGSSIWFGASIRAELESARIGSRTSIQDNCVIHTDIGFPSEIGDGVTVGHGAIIHGSKVGSNCIVGMGAILLNGSSVGENCIVGAGSLLLQGTVVPENSLVAGSPAEVKRKLREEEVRRITESADHYFEFRAEYLRKKSSKMKTRNVVAARKRATF